MRRINTTEVDSPRYEALIRAALSRHFATATLSMLYLVAQRSAYGTADARVVAPASRHAMRQTANQVDTLLEIGRKADGKIPASLISAAYRASRSTPVMLVLDSVTPREVDKMLDPVVARYGRNHQGVVYANLRDEKAVLNVAASASRVYAASDGFRAKLVSRGIAFQDVSEAEPAFDSAENE